MKERFKYSKNGVYRCENFAQNLAQNNFPSVQLGTIGGTNGWYIELVVVENGTIVYPFVHSYGKPQLHIYYYFNILGKNGESFYRLVNETNLNHIQGPCGYHMKILDLLNEKNEYLDKGTLSIEYGIHINGILGADRIWKFNFNNKLFNRDHTLTVAYRDPIDGRSKVLYCHKQLLRFHSQFFQNQETRFLSRGKEKWLIEKCLQTAHGARTLIARNVLGIASLAHDNGLRNVVQYADQQLVQIYWCPKVKSYNPLLLDNCVEYGLRHYLAHLVRHFECLEDLKGFTQQLDIEKMSGETLKTFMAKIFKLIKT